LRALPWSLFSPNEITQMTNESILYLSSREKQLLRRFARGKTDATIAMELGDKESRIAAQRKRLIEKLKIRSDDQLSMVANKLASWPKRRGSSGVVLDDVGARSAD
jgi:DNA-binding CsgD family transcriptional regulator